jgi:hypothetical protein
MSAAPASGAAPTPKATANDATTTPPKDQKPAAALEEDDEFEDFPVEGSLMALPVLIPTLPALCRREAARS